RLQGDWSSDVCSSDLVVAGGLLLLILLVVYSCGGSSGSGATNRASGATSPSPTPTTTSSELHPVIGASPTAADPGDDPSASASRSEERRVGKERTPRS